MRPVAAGNRGGCRDSHHEVNLLVRAAREAERCAGGAESGSPRRAEGAYAAGLALGGRCLAGGLATDAEMTPDGIKRILVARSCVGRSHSRRLVDPASPCVAATLSSR